MGAAKNARSISNYAYTLGLAGNRLTVAELSGRTVNYGYDSLYRLTSEALSNDPNNHDGTTSYIYDNVGNRQQLLVNGVTANTYPYDADDRLGSDQYDADGNTINSLGTANTYDFENHLVTHGTVGIVYDGDGNRVSETVGGLTTNYLVDAINPTGYAQVVDELQSGTVTRTYSYGLERISENQALNSTWTPSFYGYDGHGSVRQLTNSTGAVTDTYDYDAFGNIVSQTGSTPNNYLYAGEQFDPAIDLYYNRARYLNTTTGRFWSIDTYEGNDQDPLSLHKYLYAEGNPVDHMDRGGNQIDDVIGALAVAVVVVALSVPAGSPQEGGAFLTPQFLGTTAQNSAQLLVASALAANNDAALFTRYFGRPASARREQLLAANFGKIGGYLQHNIAYNKSTADEYAHVVVGTPDQIWLGPLFFSAPWSGIDSKPGVIVHEVSHLAVPTDDIAYGEDAAMALAAAHPDQALDNADNYEYFAERSAMPPQANPAP